MTRYRPFFLVVFLFLTGCSARSSKQASGSYVINGTMPATAKGFVYLYYNDKGIAHKDSSQINNGAFYFNGIITETLRGSLGYQKTGTAFILEPATINISSTTNALDQAVTSGTATQDEDQEMRSGLNKIIKRWKVVSDTLDAISKRDYDAYQEYKNWVLDPYFAEIKETCFAFYDKYPSSYTTALDMVVTGRDMTDDSLKMYYDRFSAQLKASAIGKDIAKQIADRKIGGIGTVAANFKHRDIEGKPLELRSLRGNYILLDFWGSWCLSCRRGNPHLLDVYAKYKDKGFEIVSIAADDDDAEAWRKAVAKDKLIWPQILQGNKPGDDLSKTYNIRSYPTKILIDKQGKIIGRFGEDAGRLDNMLSSLM